MVQTGSTLLGDNILRELFLILIFLFLTMAASAQTVTKPLEVNDVVKSGDQIIEDAFLAKDDGNGKAGDAVTSFFTTDIPIYCVVQLSQRTVATVKMNFVAVSVPGVKPDTKVVTASYTTKPNQSRVNFTGTPYDKWNSGKYRVDIFVDGKLVKDLAFDIRPASGSLDGASSFQPRAKPKRPAKQKPNE